MRGNLRVVPDLHPDGKRRVAGLIRVVLVDDHAAVRRSLRGVLDGEENIEVIAEAQDLDSLMQAMNAQPTVLALDPALPGASGLETLRQLHKRAPNTAIVVLSMNDDPSLAQQTLKAGATGFVLKDMAADELPTAVREATAGKRYVSPRIAARLAQRGDLA